MRILYFAPHPLLPLTSGGRLRDYHLGRELARHARVTFLQIASETGPAAFQEQPADEEGAFAGIATLIRGRGYTPFKIMRGMIGPSSLPVLNYSSPAMLRDLKKLLSAAPPFHSVQIENVHLLPFVPILRAAMPAVRLIADWHNIESELMKRYAVRARNPAVKLAALRTAQLLAKEEARLLRSCDAHTVPSERERSTLLRIHPAAEIHVVPNGVSVSTYIPNRTAESEPAQLLFTGSMDYHANRDGVVWFVREVWPAIVKRHPQVEFTIVGRDPPRSIQRLATGNIHVTGFVEDVRPFYRNAQVAVVPLRVGSGTRLKILEAMAAGVPVVSTVLGAEGIDAKPGTHYLQADGADGMAAAVDQLLTSPALRSSLSVNARQLVEERYDWGPIGRSLYAAHSRGLAPPSLQGR